MRGWYFLLACALGARTLMACVGDAPTLGDDDSGASSDATAGDAGGDAQNAGDGASTADTGVVIDCDAGSPGLFAPVNDAGPFCKGAAPGDHCPFGQSCCINSATLARSCAATCPDIQIQCFSPAECGKGLRCCGTGIPNTEACRFPVAASYTGSSCLASCGSGQFAECASGSDGGCTSSETCRPGYVLDPTTQASPSTIQIGMCLP